MTSIVIDCIRPPSVTAMRAAGVTGLSRYLSTLSSDPLGKIIHKAEYDALIAAGFDVVLNWEHSAQDWLGGAPAGASHASQAVAQAKALGYPKGCAIIGSADFNMTTAEWSSSGRAYALAFSSGIRAGGYVAGVYGPWDVLTWCKALGGFSVFWQAGMSTAWSGGRNKQLWPGAHLRQRHQTTIGGADVDVNDIIQPNYGQAGFEGDDMTQEEHDALMALKNALVPTPAAPLQMWQSFDRINGALSGAATYGVRSGLTSGHTDEANVLLAAPVNLDPAAFAAALTVEQLQALGTACGAELARRLAS